MDNTRTRRCGVPVWRVLEFPAGARARRRADVEAPALGKSRPRPADAGFELFSVGGAIGVSPRPFVAFFAGVDAIVALACASQS
ncbi:MAG: hypothetical protein U0168_14130 [Nannocystaceae bacterium]